MEAVKRYRGMFNVKTYYYCLYYDHASVYIGVEIMAIRFLERVYVQTY